MKKLDGMDVFWICLILLVCIWLALFLTGCTTVTYDRTTGTVSYHRVGGTEFRKLEIVRQDNDVLLTIEQYRTEPVAEVAGSVAEGVVRGLKPQEKGM